MNVIQKRAILPKMELIPREGREHPEIRYREYCERLRHREMMNREG